MDYCMEQFVDFFTYLYCSCNNYDKIKLIKSKIMIYATCSFNQSLFIRIYCIKNYLLEIISNYIFFFPFIMSKILIFPDFGAINIYK